MLKRILFSILIFTSSYMMASNLPIKNQDVSPKQLESQNKQILTLVVNELSKNLPKKIDDYTNFIKIEAKNTKLIYTFEINTGSKSDESIIKEDHKRMKKSITNGVCRSSKRFLDAQITIVYKYISASSKNELFKFEIAQKDCLVYSK